MNEKDVLENLESALKKVKDQKENFGFMDRFNVDENYVVMKALEKQIPEEPIKAENIYPDNQRKCKCGCFVSTVYKNRGCVTCVNEIAYRFCPNCGQKLKGWKY